MQDCLTEQNKSDGQKFTRPSWDSIGDYHYGIIMGVSAVFLVLSLTSFAPKPPQQIPASHNTGVLDLAKIMQGESTSDLRAAYYVGWVAKNRLLTGKFGHTYKEVALNGFNAYKYVGKVDNSFIRLAKIIIRAKHDPTKGCLFALSRTDITNLGIRKDQADATRGEWFFFIKWPVKLK